MNYFKQYLLLVSFFALGVIITAAFFGEESREDKKNSGFKSCQNQYSLISSEIDCGTINDDITQTQKINSTIENFIALEKKTGKADEISVFYRDLNTRQWFGVNENIQFYPASVAKLPTAMMFYKVAEVDKEILETPNTIIEEDTKLNDGQHYKPPEKLEAGRDYSTRELLRRILTYSDNVPLRILMEEALPFSAPVFLDLGVTFPANEGDTVAQWNTTTRTISNLFRILYNASYIRPQYSNIILEQLADSSFKNGLVAGIPVGTKVAHKYGEASETNEKTGEIYIVLNDCGIVYKESNPYIICVMTQGKDFDDLETIIKTISEKVYDSL